MEMVLWVDRVTLIGERLAGPDALVVMCIRGRVIAKSDSFSDFYSLKKIEYKRNFIGMTTKKWDT